MRTLHGSIGHSYYIALFLHQYWSYSLEVVTHLRPQKLAVQYSKTRQYPTHNCVDSSSDADKMTVTTHPEFDQHTEGSVVAENFAETIRGKTILVTGVNRKGIGFTISAAFVCRICISMFNAN